MTEIQNVKIKWNRPVLFAGLGIAGISVVLANILSYVFSFYYESNGVIIGSSIGAIIGVVGNYILLSSQQLIKEISLPLQENVNLKDTVEVVSKDKEGNVKETRNGS